MRSVILLSAASLLILGAGAAAFGEIGLFGALLLCFFLFNAAPVRRDDIEAVLIILAILGVVLSIAFGMLMPDIAGPYY